MYRPFLMNHGVHI